MTDAAEFVDAALQRESSYERAIADAQRLGGGLRYYGASVGAVRGAVRDASRRYRGLGHDAVTALSSELWAVPVFERRLAAVVLLQSNVALLDNSDLTRIEGFVRSARLRALIDPLAVDVVGPMIESLGGRSRQRGEAALDRWATDDPPLRRAAVLAPLRSLRSGGGDWDDVVRRCAIASSTSTDDEVMSAIRQLATELSTVRPELHFPANFKL
jgi:hypothetical protein